MKVKSVRDLKNLKGRRVLLRADFNVGLAGGRVRDDFRITAGLPTIRHLISRKAKVIIMTHVGKPAGVEAKFSTRPIARDLEKKLGIKVAHAADCVGFKAEEAVAKLEPGNVLMLENLRFHPEEKANDRRFASRLARLADVYVNDAFAVCHRVHASVEAIRKYLPRVAGLLLESEIKNLDRIIAPKRPLVVIVGGAKISTKLPLLIRLSKKADKVLIGGGTANNFLFALGQEIGKSLADKKDYVLAGQAAEYYEKTGDLLNVLPVDFITSKTKTGNGQAAMKTLAQIERDDYIFDVGPKTLKIFSGIIKKANTIVWNGPLGMFENEKFKHGTFALARLVAGRASGRAFGLVGGGETIEAFRAAGIADYVDWISTGGGAMLAYLGGEKMPGLKGIIK